MLGPYAVEQDYSHYVSKASQVILGVVGTATKGEIGQAILCTSSADFIRKFGEANKDHIATYAALYYLNNGNKLYFVRTDHATESEGEITHTAAKATVAIPGTTGTATPAANALTMTATTPGTYYNGIKVVVSEVTGVTGSYNIVVKDKGITVENKVFKVSDDPATYKSSYATITAKAEGLATLTPGTYTLANGTDGTASIAAADYIRDMNALSSDLVDMNLFSVPGQSDISVITAAITLAETRGDCMYLIDPPDGLTPEEVMDWSNGTGDYSHTAFNTSYAAIYYSWQVIYDPKSATYIHVPPSVPVASAIARSAHLSEIWFAPAGTTRGVLQGVSAPVYAPNSGEREAMYSGTNIVNSIINDPTYGLCIFGQKTCLRTQTALDRVNVRMLLNYLKRVVVAACKYLTFEPNDATTWTAFEDLVEPTLRSIGQRRGLYDYKIVVGEAIITDEDIDEYRMPCKILIKPTKSVEEIPIYFNITSTGADFNVVLESQGIITD